VTTKLPGTVEMIFYVQRNSIW